MRFSWFVLIQSIFNLEMESVPVCSVPLIFKQINSISTNPDHQTLHPQPTIQECYPPCKLLGLILQNHSTARGKTFCLRLLLKRGKNYSQKGFLQGRNVELHSCKIGLYGVME